MNVNVNAQIGLDSTLKRIAWAYGCAKKGSLEEARMRALLERKMRHVPPASARSPYESLAWVVRNSGGEEAVGGVAVTTEYDPDSELYEVNYEAGEDSGGASAPDFGMALQALPFLSEGEGVVLDAQGQPVCIECTPDNRAACIYCKGTGRDSTPPHAWPPGGLLELLGEP